MSFAPIESLIKAKKTEIAEAKESQRFYVERYNTIISDLEMRLEELEERLEELEKHAPYPINTKFKWVSNVNTDTYCVAIVTKKGILEVKNVFEGGGLCHNTLHCACKQCAKIRALNDAQSPVRLRAPLVKTLFATEDDWLKTLHTAGKMIITLPSPMKGELNSLIFKPLTGVTDALKLNELQLRFPGAKFILNCNGSEYPITFEFNPVYGNIRCEKTNIFGSNFATFGSNFAAFGVVQKPNITAEWRNIRFSVSHLF